MVYGDTISFYDKLKEQMDMQMLDDTERLRSTDSREFGVRSLELGVRSLEFGVRSEKKE